jgi:hypothetical protein
MNNPLASTPGSLPSSKIKYTNTFIYPTSVTSSVMEQKHSKRRKEKGMAMVCTGMTLAHPTTNDNTLLNTLRNGNNIPTPTILIKKNSNAKNVFTAADGAAAAYLLSFINKSQICDTLSHGRAFWCQTNLNGQSKVGKKR